MKHHPQPNNVNVVYEQERGTATEPPPRLTFSGNVTQWEIFDAYQEDFEKQVQGNFVL